MLKGDLPCDFDNLTEDEQSQLLEWITNNLIYIHTTNTRYTSYSLKHIYERQTGNYVTNGQFKGAMLKAGFIPQSERTLNWCFNVSQRSPAFKK